MKAIHPHFLLIGFLHIFVSTFAQVQIGQDIDGYRDLDYMGSKVSISANGQYIAVGARNYDGASDTMVKVGLVRLFELQGGTWTQMGQDLEGEAKWDQFGGSISISANGMRVAIGAPGNDGAGSNAGHVRVYEWTNGSWVQLGSDIEGESPDDRSSRVSMAANGNRVAIGAPSNDAGPLTNAGHVRVYEWLNGAWIKVGQDIEGEDSNDGSGSALALSADGSRVAIGAGENYGSISAPYGGHVRVYELQNGTWTQMGQDIDGEHAHDKSGTSVSISALGDRVAIGARLNDDNGFRAGHVRVFDYQNGAWTQVGQDLDGEAELDYSGAVSLSADGSRVAIGAYHNDGTGPVGNVCGHTRVFQLVNGTWLQVGTDMDGEGPGDQSGVAVALASDGSSIVIGATHNRNDSLANFYNWGNGHARVYALPALRPDLIIDSASLDTTAYFPGDTLTLQATVDNLGNLYASNFRLKVYLSADSLLDTTDLPLDSRFVPLLEADSSEDFTLGQLQIPLTELPSHQYLYLVVDDDSVVTELDEANNGYVLPIEILPFVDLTISSVQLDTVQVGPGDYFSSQLISENLGNVGSGNFLLKAYLSSDTLLSANDQMLDTLTMASLPAWGTDTLMMDSMTLPMSHPAGPAFIVFSIDADSVVAERDEGNNQKSASIQVAPVVDLIVTHFSLASDSVEPGDYFTGEAWLKNKGNSLSAPCLALVYLSTDTVLSVDDLPLDTLAIVPVNSLETDTIMMTTLQIPLNQLPNASYLLLHVDADGDIDEPDEQNNLAAAAITITESFNLGFPPAGADSLTVTAGDSATVTTTIYNQGNVLIENFQLTAAIHDTLGNLDTLLYQVSMDSIGAFDSSFVQIFPLPIPEDQAPGLYHLHLQLSPDSTLKRNTEADNTQVIPLIVEKRQATSISAIQSPAFTLYPNPARQVVTLRGNRPLEEGIELKVYTLTGKLYLSRSLGTMAAGSKLHIPTDTWPDGVYQFTLFDPRDGTLFHVLLAVQH